MGKSFNEDEETNIRLNLRYFIDQMGITFHPTKFEYGDFGINLSKETFYSAYYAGNQGCSPSHRTIRIIAEALSAYIKDDYDLEKDDFILSKDKFVQKYSDKIVRDRKGSEVHFELFENKLFRCYYLLPVENHQTMLGYFKIFTLNDGSISAFLLRGINYFDDSQNNLSNKLNDRDNAIKRMIHGFISPQKIKDEFIYYKNNHKKKEDERIHLYSADSKDIHISKSCIKIDFEIVDDLLNYKSTMFWNIEPITKTKNIKTIIGGLALMVDTNDGDRQMCAYKMGLDAVGLRKDPLNGDPYFSNKPLCCESPSILNELSISSEKRVYLLDRVEDTLWYHFIQDDSRRKETSKMYTEKDYHEVIESFEKMRREYQKQLYELKQFVDKQKKV